MSFFVSKEIKENIDFSIENNDRLDEDVIDVTHILSDDKNITMTYISKKNNLKKTVKVKKFLLCQKEYFFKQDLEFNLLHVKKENTKLVTKIIICKEKFWRYLDNEEY